MRTVIAGGHGQIALHLERLLAARGDTPVGLIRNPAQSDDLRAAGAEPVAQDRIGRRGRAADRREHQGCFRRDHRQSRR